MRLAATLLILSCVGGARAERASSPAWQQQPAADAVTVAIGARRAGAGTAPPRRRDLLAEQHRLPPDLTTRTDAGAARAARSPSPRPLARSACSTKRASRKPTSPTPPISSTAPIARNRPVTFLFNGGPGASSAWLQFGAAGPWRLSITGEGAVHPRRRTWCPTPRPGSTSPISSSSIPSAPATAVSSRPVRTRASGSTRSTATSARSRW